MEKALLYSNILLWVIQAGVIFCLLMVFRQFGEVYLKSADAISRDGIPIGDTIPRFKGFSLPNLRKITSEEIQGRPTLLAFISPNCGACKDMIPDWNEAYRKYGHKVNFVLMGTGKEEEYKPFLKKRQVNGLLIYDKDEVFLEDFRVRVTPFAFVLDEKGVVKGKGLCNSMEHIEQFITKDASVSLDKQPTIEGVS